MSDLVILKNTILTTQESFEKIASADINFQKEMNFAIQQLESNAYSMSIAIKSPDSLRNAMVNISAIGLSLNPATKLAYLVPRGGKICLDISYMGLVKLATDSGSILWAQAQIVREKDTFLYNGLGTIPTHTFDPFSNDRGDIRGVYSVVKTAHNEFLTELMSLNDLLDIRDRTEAYKAYKDGKTKSCPWISDESEMMKKTVIRRAYKLWPKSQRLNDAINILNQHDGIDFAKEKEIRDVTPPEESELDKLKSMIAELENGETRLLAHINIKYAPKEKIESLDDFNFEQVKYSLCFIKEHVEKERKKKTAQTQGAQA